MDPGSQARFLQELAAELASLRSKVGRLERATGTGSAGGVAALDDLSDVVLGVSALGHVLQYDGAQWINGLATDTNVAAANKDGAAGTAGMRTLGTGSLQAAAGDHVHDSRYYTETEVDTALALKANLASPTFTGDPKAPTPAAGDDDTSIPTTAWVNTALGNPSTARPACRVYKAADQSIADATDVAITLDTERYDNDSMHDTVTNNTRVTIVTPGVYAISGMVHFAANATGIRRVWIRLNGSTILAEETELTPSGTQVSKMTVSTQYQFVATDYIELVVRHSAGTAINVNATANTSPELAVAYIGASTGAWGVAAAKATKSASQSITSGGAAVQWDGTDEFDTGTMHDPASNNTRITVPVTGTYSVSASVNLDGATTDGYLKLRKNGADTNVAVEVVGDHRIMNLSAAAIQLVANDYLEIYAVSATTRNCISTFSHFSVVRVGYQANPLDQPGTYMASMYAANSGSPTHTSNGGWQKVGSGGGTLTWTSEYDRRPSGVAAQVDTATNKRIDIKKTGVYLVTGTVYLSSITAAKTLAVAVYKNGAEFLNNDTGSSGAGGSNSVNVAGPLLLTSGDYLELYAFQNDSASEAYGTSSNTSRIKLTATYMGPST